MPSLKTKPLRPSPVDTAVENRLDWGILWLCQHRGRLQVSRYVPYDWVHVLLTDIRRVQRDGW